MPYEADHRGYRVIGYNEPISFYDPDRNLRAQIFLQTDNTLNIGGIAAGYSAEGDQIDIAHLTDGHFLMVAVDADLANSRALTAGDGIDIVDAGPGNAFILSIDTSDFLTEGPGTDLVWTGESVAIGMGGDTILLFDSGGDPVREFAASDAGLTSALAAMAAGDTLKLPSVTITGGPWTVAHGSVVGTSREGSVLDGQVTVNDGTALETLTIERSEDDAGAIYGIVDGGGTATLTGVTVNVANATGATYAVYMASGGTINADDCELLAQTGSAGYAAYVTLGDFYQRGGRAVGAVTGLPYWLT